MCPLAFSSYLQAPVPFIIGEGREGGRGEREGREGVRRRKRGKRTVVCVGESRGVHPHTHTHPHAPTCTHLHTCTHPHMHTGIDSQYFDVFEKPVDVCVVDLDANLITL